jgi:hypothetical protein
VGIGRSNRLGIHEASPCTLSFQAAEDKHFQDGCDYVYEGRCVSRPAAGMRRPPHVHPNGPGWDMGAASATSVTSVSCVDNNCVVRECRVLTLVPSVTLAADVSVRASDLSGWVVRELAVRRHGLGDLRGRALLRARSGRRGRVPRR